MESALVLVEKSATGSPHGFTEYSNIVGNHRRAATHGLRQTEAECLVAKRGNDCSERVGIEFDQLLFGIPGQEFDRRT